MMTIALIHILARGEDDWTKLIGGLVFFLVWAISAIVQWVSKQKKAADEARQREQTRRSIQTQQPPVQPQQPSRPVQISEGLARRFPEVARPPTPPRVARRPVPPPQARKVKVPPPPPPLAPTVTRGSAPTVQSHQPVSSTAMGSGNEIPKRPVPSGAGAPAIAKWLSPRTLRQQFILTELFQPPLALREKQM